MYQRAPNGTVVRRFGVDTAVVRLIGHAMNFSVRFDEPADGMLTTAGSTRAGGPLYNCLGDGTDLEVGYVTTGKQQTMSDARDCHPSIDAKSMILPLNDYPRSLETDYRLCSRFSDIRIVPLATCKNHPSPTLPFLHCLLHAHAHLSPFHLIPQLLTSLPMPSSVF